MGIMASMRGGLEIPEKHRHEDFDAIGNAFIPATAIVPLSERFGVTARCVVSPGQDVEECQVIGRSDNPRSANVHSPIPGKIRSIKEIDLPDGSRSQAVMIDLAGSFSRLGRKQEFFPWKSLSSSEIDHILVEKGVLVFSRKPESPHGIFAAAKKSGCQTIIVNAMDQEPYGFTETLLCSGRPLDIAMGTEIAMKACGALRAVLALNAKKSEHYSRLKSSLDELKVKYECVEVEARFPQGFDSSVRSAALSTLPRRSGKDELGNSVVLNPSTLVAVFEAVALNKAFVERTVTVLGDAISNPSALKARVGTRIGDLIGECGGFKCLPERIVINGSMTGFTVADLDIPVMKSMTSILALTASEIRKSKPSACIRCARCIEACPEDLNPERLIRLIRFSREDREVAAELERCTLCGACGYVCPSRVPLVDVFSRASAALTEGKDADGQ